MGTVRYNVINGQVISENRGGVIRDYIPDALGNTVALMDNTGTLTDTFDYFPSGTVAARTGTNPTPFQWNGGSGYFTDSSTRKYVRARNYFNSTGRWGSQDPIGFKAGDFNLYRYVNNNVINVVNPSGLACKGYSIKGELIGNGCRFDAGLIRSGYSSGVQWNFTWLVPKSGNYLDCWVVQYLRSDTSPGLSINRDDLLGWPYPSSCITVGNPKKCYQSDSPGISGSCFGSGRFCNAKWMFTFLTCLCGTEGKLQCIGWKIDYELTNGVWTSCSASKLTKLPYLPKDVCKKTGGISGGTPGGMGGGRH